MVAFDQAAIKKTKALAYGLPAGPGAASGKICFTAEKAEMLWLKAVMFFAELKQLQKTSRMIAADGISLRGGVSSHAALVARQMNKVCVCGA